MRDHRRAGAAFAATAGLAAFAAQPAAAAPEWNDGLPEDHFTQTCESIGGVGGYREEHSSQVKVGTFVDPQNIPKVGRGLLRPRRDGRGRGLRRQVVHPGGRRAARRRGRDLGRESRALPLHAPGRLRYGARRLSADAAARAAWRALARPGRQSQQRVDRRRKDPGNAGPDTASGRDRLHRVPAARLAPADGASGRPNLRCAHRSARARARATPPAISSRSPSPCTTSRYRSLLRPSAWSSAPARAAEAARS